MQSKNAIAIVHVMAGMCGMHKLCALFGIQMLGRVLKYSTLLPVHTRKPCNSSFKV